MGCWPGICRFCVKTGISDCEVTDVCAGAGQGLTRQEWANYIPGVPYRAPC